MVFYFLNVLLVELIELLFLGLEGLQNFTLNHMVPFLLQLSDHHLQLLYLANLAHALNIVQGLGVMGDDVGILMDLLDVGREVILHLGMGNIIKIWVRVLM